MAKRSVEGVDVYGGGGCFRFPTRDSATNNVYRTTCRLRVVPLLAVRLADQGKYHSIAPDKLKSDPVFATRVGVALKGHGL